MTPAVPWRLAIVCCLGLAGSRMYAETTMLDNMEAGVGYWTHGWGGADNTITETGVSAAGAKALNHTVANYIQYAEVVNTHLLDDLSAYETIAVQARLSTADPAHPQGYKCWIRLYDADGEIWRQKNPVVLTDVYQIVQAPLKTIWNDPSGFELVENGVNWQLTFAQIVKIGLFCEKPTTSQKSFYFDELCVWKADAPSASLTVSPAGLGFGILHPSRTDRRFLSGYATVDYSVTGYSAWQIEVYSAHPDGAEGLKGQTQTDRTLPLKVWCGTPAETPPDPETDANWGGASPLFSYVTDENNAWHFRAAYAPGNEIPSGFRLYFATDAAGAVAQDYHAPIVVELTIP